MVATRKSMRVEAGERLRVLVAMGMDPRVLEDFERGVISCSQQVKGLEDGRKAAVSPLDEERFGSLVQKFEKRSGHLVYHVMLEDMSFGPVLYLFFVSAFDEDLESDRKDLAERFPMAYGANLLHPESSDLGSVPIAISGGVFYDDKRCQYACDEEWSMMGDECFGNDPAGSEVR